MSFAYVTSALYCRSASRRGTSSSAIKLDRRPCLLAPPPAPPSILGVVDRATRLAIVGLAITVFAFGHRFWQPIIVAVAALVALELVPRLRVVTDRVSRLLKGHERVPEVVAHPIPTQALAVAGPVSLELGWGPNEAKANDVAGRYVLQLRRPITAPPALNLPPQRTGPWRPAGHGPDPIGSETCVCGQTGVTDWPAHIAEATTRGDMA